MKKYFIGVIIFYLIIFVIVFVSYLFYSKNYLYVDGNFYINDNIYLNSTSLYQTKLIVKFEKETRVIIPCVFKIGWNEKNVTVLQYDIIVENNHEYLDKSTANYYVISLDDETVKGPFSELEFDQYECSSIKMKRTVF